MNRKSQITIFIIIGVIILMLATMTFMSWDKLGMFSSQGSVTDLQDYVESCVEYVGGYGLYKLGMQGGSISMPIQYYNVLNLQVAYAYNNGKKLPSLQEMEVQLSVYLEQNLNLCVNEYIIESKLDERIDVGAPSAKTTIAKNDVLFEVKLPISISVGSSVTKNNKAYNVIIPVRLREIHGIVSDMAEKKAINPEDIYLDCLYETVEITANRQNDVTLFLIQDNRSRLFNEPYKFIFAMI